MSHGPAHHSSLATVKNTPVVGVSGPPGGAEFALRFYLQPLMRAMLSLDPAPLTLKVRYAEEFKRGHYAKMGTQPGNASSTGAGEDTGEGAAAAANPTTTEPVMKEYKVINEGFRAIKPALVTLAEDGVLEVRPAGRAGSEQALNANALCLLPDNPAAAGLHVGGLIEVELKR
jgi:molybdopterin biosynthesis enzyme